MANRKMTLSKTKTASSVLKQVGISAALLVASSTASALGLGALEVQSNLDQPLNGTIQLRTSAGDDVRTLKAIIAERKDFEKLGIDYPDYLENLSLVVEEGGSGKVLRIRSNGIIINEPFIHFLVRIEWSGGSFLREYTALIDPPVYAAEAPKVLAEPRAVGTDQAYQEESDPVEDNYEAEVAVDEIETDDVAIDDRNEDSDIEEPTTAEDQPLIEDDFYEGEDEEATDADASTADVANDGASYGPVEKGESLSLIAQELQRQFPDLSIYSIMQVMFEENQSAFIKSNINGLIQGAVLDIGDLNTIRAVDAQAAKDFFRSQLQDWDPSVLAASSGDSINVGQDDYSYSATDSDDAGEDADDFADSFQVGASDAVDDFVSGDQGDNRDGEVLAMREQMSDLQSSLASSEAEKIELKERVSMLEGRIADLTSLVDIENSDMAQVQDSLAQQDTDAADINEFDADGTVADDSDSGVIDEFLSDGVDSMSEAVDDVTADAGDVVDATDDVLGDFIDDTESVVEDGVGEFLDDADEAVADGVDGVTDAVDDAADSVINDVDDSVDEVMPESTTPPLNKQESQSFFDKAKSMVFDGGLWKVLAGVGGLLLAGIVFLFFRRRRADEEFEISMLSIESNSQSIDTSQSETQSASISTSVASVAETVPDKETSFLTVYSDSDAVVQADEVDPVAEADVYIAYGRDEQAEEVLLDGIASNPERVDIKHKLLTHYHKTENSGGFERVAEELYAQRESITPEVWEEVCTMGKEVAPQNPLFELSVGDLSAGGSSAVAAGVASTVAGAKDKLTDAVSDVKDGAADAVPDIESSLNDENSIQLVNFEDGRSEVSELDEVDIDALDLDGTSIAGDPEKDVIEFNDSSLDGFLAETPSPDEGSVLEIDLEDGAELDTQLGDDSALSIGEGSEVSDLEIDPDYDEARTQYELAKVFVDLGDEDGAHKILKELVANDDNDQSVIADAQKLLDSIKG